MKQVITLVELRSKSYTDTNLTESYKVLPSDLILSFS